jgi:hypothetical protein
MADPISIKTQLTTITVDDDVGDPVAIGGVESITGLGSSSASEIDITTLASTAKEFRQGLRDFGSITITFSRRNRDDVGQAELASMYAAQDTRTFIITLPESTANVITFEGFVTQITTDIAADNVVSGSATVRVTGADSAA